MKSITLAAAAALYALLLVTPGYAEVEVGAEAPDLGAKDFFNTEPVKFAELKGRLILLELFSTT